ncbi:peptidoglycan editing factor PgeF [Pelagibacteraceae bacterium]|nr:peptidoglycan editing factor PgeF [Pelagibacteraceae bacterium]
MSKNYFYLKKFEKIINIGFFSSRGGMSKEDYHSLNCSKANNDNKNNVLKNIKIAKKNLGIAGKQLKLISQIHSNKVIKIDKKNYKSTLVGDGLITKNKDIALGILTADCAPIFIFDYQKKIICSLHSGWKGTLSNIVASAIKKINKNKIDNNKLIAIIGPCLGYKYFEVDKKFKSKFIKKNNYYSKFFKYKNKNKDYFNLRGILNYQLNAEGISQIYNIKKDTYKNSDYFFSHRRATHQNKKFTGRMINIISFRD